MSHKAQQRLSEDMRVFLEHLLAQAGIHPVVDEIHSEMLAQLAERLEAKLTWTAIGRLPAEKVAEFQKLLRQDSSEAVLREYLEINVPNIEQIYAQTLEDFRQIYLGR